MADMTRTISLAAGGATVDLSVSEQGAGRPYLLLHGGGGPATMAAFAELLARSNQARVIVPTHPGFGGSARPDSLTTVRGLAGLYTQLLAELDLTDVVVIGNSMGGWIAAEMAADHGGRVGAVVIVNGVGIEVPGHPVADFFSLTPREIAERSYHDPDRFGIDPSKLPEEALQVMAGNRAALTLYAGTAMRDETLAPRLGSVKVPALVVWGADDRIVDLEYGRAFAAAIPGAEFEVLTEAGHLPQIESPERLLEAVAKISGA
jgi:pimeloyl-ACP methyl ester carboxylesterase